MQKLPRLFPIVVSLLFSTGSFAGDNPKYGPQAQPLSKRTNQEYFKRSAAPDFWALIPYYIGQDAGQRCSITNITLVMNAIRSKTELKSDQKLFGIEEVLEKYTDDKYKASMTKGLSIEKFDRSNVANARLAGVIENAIQKSGIGTPKSKVELAVVDQKDLEKGRKLFHQHLVQNEKSSDDFIIISFIQGKLTGDPEGGAHVATIGAYDEKKGLVLIMDPDREWYEPYWSPEKQVFEAVADPRSDHEKPGWLYIRAR
jgi:hypothetical protein